MRGMPKEHRAKSAILFNLNLFVSPADTPAAKGEGKEPIDVCLQCCPASHKTLVTLKLSSCHLLLQNTECHGNRY